METADGSTIEISAEDVSPQEQQQNDSMEEGPELQEGVQLSLFDETSDQPTQEATEPVQEETDPSDFAEVEVSELSPQAMQEAGFSKSISHL